MSDVLSRIEAYKRRGDRGGEGSASPRPRSSGEPVRPPRRAASRRPSSAIWRRSSGPDRRGQEGEPSKGLIRADFDPPAWRGLCGGRRDLPFRSDGRAVLPGQARLSDAGARGIRPPGSAQGFSVRALPGIRSAGLGRGLHPRHHGERHGRGRPRAHRHRARARHGRAGRGSRPGGTRPGHPPWTPS